MKKLLSICIPTYNRCDQLGSMLNNLLNTIDQIENVAIEIIVSDNDSEDKTEEVVEEHLGKVIYYKQKNNLGYDGNIKFLYSVAKGTYIFFLADDDEIMVNEFIELYRIIWYNQEEIDCYLLNYFEGDKKVEKHDYIDSEISVIKMHDICENYYKPFVFLSGFVFKKKEINLANINKGTFFSQMDIALSVLSQSSHVYYYKGYVVKRIIPDLEDETGCNIMDETWKIYLGSAKIRRKYEKKYNAKSPYFLEIIQVILFSRNYINLPNKSWIEKIKYPTLAFSNIHFKYMARVIFFPFMLLLNIKKVYKYLKKS